MTDAKIRSVGKLLIKNRWEDDDFGWEWLYPNKSPSLKDANKFLLACIIDYQTHADVAWQSARRFAEDILGDPKWLWNEIVSISLPIWMSRQEKYSLHRYPKAHERVWTIGNRIVQQYDGDARKIWKNQSIEAALYRLIDLKVGEQISRMVVGALFDTGLIQGKSDVKVDIHVRRVLGRVFYGEQFSASNVGEVIDLTRKMHPANPWLLDRSLFELGRNNCVALSPKCDECYLGGVCTHSNR
jgi:endonuclease III